MVSETWNYWSRWIRIESGLHLIRKPLLDELTTTLRLLSGWCFYLALALLLKYPHLSPVGGVKTFSSTYGVRSELRHPIVRPARTLTNLKGDLEKRLPSPGRVALANHAG